jgi:hypothetical protein
VIYNFIEREFSYEPPIRKKRNDVRVRHNIVPHALVAHNNNWQGHQNPYKSGKNVNTRTFQFNG